MTTRAIPTRLVDVEASHPAWTPVNPDGSTPALAGTGAVAPGDWQPLCIGVDDVVVGDAVNNVTFRADAGLMVKLGGYQANFEIEVRTGDGDTSVQRRPKGIADPQARSFSAVIQHGYRGYMQMLRTVRADPQRRPLTLRETYYEVAEIDGTALMLNGAAVAGATKLTVDGADAAKLEVDDLITIGASPTLYLVLAHSLTSIEIDKGLAATGADNDPVRRAQDLRRRTQQFYLAQWQETRGAGETMMVTCQLQPHSDAVSEGV